MDIQPVNSGHVLVVPNAHATYLSDLDEDTGGLDVPAGAEGGGGLVPERGTV